MGMTYEQIFRIFPDLTFPHVVSFCILETPASAVSLGTILTQRHARFKVLFHSLKRSICFLVKSIFDVIEEDRILNLLVIVCVLSFRRLFYKIQ
jgi:hypothetical protein